MGSMTVDKKMEQSNLQMPILQPGIEPTYVEPERKIDATYSAGLVVRASHASSEWHSLSRRGKIREALLLTFCDPVPRECSRLWLLMQPEWQRALHWLDVSGLALYFLDRIERGHLTDIVPEAVMARLRRNLADNTQRTAAMMAELAAIHSAFQKAGLAYAILKGFSLWPQSVPRPELRSQLDLDFLIAEKGAAMGRRILESRGYRLHAISGRSWEFKCGEFRGGSVEDIYKDTPFRSVELHVECSDARDALLERREQRRISGIWMPVLSDVDLFLGQGLHLYKHVCSEFSRAAHLVEFRQHVLVRREDAAFWTEMRAAAEKDARAPLALGVVTLLITNLMGSFAPDALTCWTVDRLPAEVRLWVAMYGHRVVFSDFPGTKLYLLLQSVMETSGAPAKRTVRRTLVPLRLPPPIAHEVPGETVRTRMRRHWFQLRFIFWRLRFHSVEDVRYLWESWRWRRALRRLSS